MQEVSGVYASPFLHRDERKMALRARKVSRAFEKRTPGPQIAFANLGGTVTLKDFNENNN